MNKKYFWIPTIVILLSFYTKSVVLFIISLSIFAYMIMKFEIVHKHKSDKRFFNNDTKDKNIKINNAVDVISGKYLSNEFIQLYNEISKEFCVEEEYYDNNCCPYCGIVFDKKIKNSKKCSSCGNHIWKRSNYMTKQCYLLTDIRMSKFNDYKQKASDLYFYENLIKSKEYFFNNDFDKSKQILKNLIDDYRNKHVSVRDIVWNFFQDYRNKYEQDTMTLLIKMSKKDDILDKLEIHNMFTREGFKSNSFLRGMFEIAKYNGHYDVALDLLATFVYNSQVIKLVYYGIDDYAEINHVAVYQECYPNMIIDFLNETSYNLEDFKKSYFRVGTLLKTFNLLKNEHGWQYILDSIEWYNESINTN